MAIIYKLQYRYDKDKDMNQEAAIINTERCSHDKSLVGQDNAISTMELHSYIH